MQLWLGAWHGMVSAYEGTYLRFFTRDGNLVLTEAEAERQRADEQQQRAETAETEMARLRERLAAIEKSAADGTVNGKQ